MLKEWGAFSGESAARPIAKHAPASGSRARRTSNCFCCNTGSMKLATRSAAAARVTAPPRFLVAYGQSRAARWPHANPGVLPKGFGSFRRPFARLPRGALLDRRAGGPNAAQPDTQPSAPLTYGRIPPMASIDDRMPAVGASASNSNPRLIRLIGRFWRLRFGPRSHPPVDTGSPLDSRPSFTDALFFLVRPAINPRTPVRPRPSPRSGIPLVGGHT